MPKFVPRQRKHKARQRTADSTTKDDSNVAELRPSSKSERDERRAQLQAELRAQQPSSKASSKKKKRLEKYIDTKLKKDENLELLKKLSQQNVDTSLLRSSKRLGRGGDSNREALGRALKERRAGIRTDDNDEVLFTNRTDPNQEPDFSSGGEDSAQENADTLGPAVQPTPSEPVPAFGSGLKRPLNLDADGNIVALPRKRLKKAPTRLAESEEPESDSGWEGFSSSTGSDQDPSELSDSEVEDDEASEESDDEDISDDSSNGSDLDDEESKEEAKQRSSVFKAWATQQRNNAVGFVPSTAADYSVLPERAAPSDRSVVRQTTNRVNVIQPGPVVLAPEASQVSGRAVFNVSVKRSAEVEDARLQLPVVAEEQRIMETIFHNGCTILCGSTGSGKTTQVPQFLYEAGFGHPDSQTPGMIGVTQPRRVAAVSMARRVAYELGDAGEKVSHQVRFDSTVSHKTAIKFMTDGVLLREVSQDFTLSKYSAIVIDEAHERSVNTDILIGMLSRIVETRKQLANKDARYRPLKLIIMSATLRVDDFAQNKALFRQKSPPIVEAEGRQHQVTIHFARRTRRDYVEDVFQKVLRGHKKLPPGGMLVFLTGQNEIAHLQKRLTESFSSTSNQTDSKHPAMRVSASSSNVEAEDMELGRRKGTDPSRAEDSDSEVSIRGLDDEDEDEDQDLEIGEEPDTMLKVHVLPLYSQLPADQQMRVFEPPPDGSRLIVLATNVAETSLTIPGVRYVFDCGRAKEKQYDAASGVQTFAIDWISKASASQRAGRAGRTGPGHCYRLYSSAVYERDFADFSVPEIQRSPVEGVVLQLKSMGIPNVAYFPFPTPPDRDALLKAERLLEHLGALADGKVTSLGNQLAIYPLSPRLSRILVAAGDSKLLAHAIGLVAALAVPDIFISEGQLGLRDPPPTAETDSWTQADSQAATLREQRRKEYNSFHGNAARLDRHSDALKLLTTLYDYSANANAAPLQHYTRTKGLKEAQQLRHQLTALVAANAPNSTPPPPPSLPLPSPAHVKALRHLLVAGYIDQIAQRADLSPTPPARPRKSTRATDVPYIPLFATHTATHDAADDPDAAERATHIYIHGASVLAHVPAASLPQYIVYSHLSRAAPASVGGPARAQRTRLHALGPATAEQLVELARGTPLLGEGKPVGRIDELARGDGGEERRACWSVPFLKGGAGGREWPLPPARRVVQRRVKGKGWVTEAEQGDG